MGHVYVHKAQPTGSETITSKTIHIEQELPRELVDEISYAAFELDADKLHEALYHSLPGGTYDQLLCLMLKHKASHFIVAHSSPEEQ